MSTNNALVEIAEAVESLLDTVLDLQTRVSDLEKKLAAQSSEQAGVSNGLPAVRRARRRALAGVAP